MEPSDYIKSVRKKLGLNQTELAQLLFPSKDPRITQSYISRYESGRTAIKLDVFLKLQELEQSMHNIHTHCKC
jgi:transcriptional regulator with XRE-family HTH domain